MDNRMYIARGMSVWLVVCIGILFLCMGFLHIETCRAADTPGQSPDGVSAQDILDATGIRGGLIVHAGCRDGKLSAALRASDSYLVHGLDADAANVAKAREHIRSKGCYGPVCVDTFGGERLPYADGIVNLLVGEDLGRVTMDEVIRVLCPNGVAYVQQDGKWTKTVKPRPGEIDEWTHYLHDATNNAVAHDVVVGPPRRLQWLGGPKWARHHDNMSSVSSLVSSGGRVFYIFDEGSRSSILLPSKWALIARDAFNGSVLWKRAIPRWHFRLWPLKRGPVQLTRRLVAVGDTVYAPLDIDAPLTALDGETGETIRTYEGTEGTEEIIYSGGMLFLVVRPQSVESTLHRDDYENLAALRRYPLHQWQPEPRIILAVKAETGVPLWQARTPVAYTTLAADGRSVYFYDGEKVVCLDRASGRNRWLSAPLARRPKAHSGYAPTLVVYEDIVLFAGGEKTITALSADSGQNIWSDGHKASGFNSPEDLLVVGGLVWSTTTVEDLSVWTGRDLKTGEIRNELLPDVDTYWFHHRCYRCKATERFLLPSRAGVEFVDFNRKTWEPHHWVRGACIYGIMPCNGLIYAPQHPCACYIGAMLNGFNALAPASKGPRIPKEAAAEERLERGPAYGEIPSPRSQIPNPDDWPTYRNDSTRSGFTRTSVSTELKQAWVTELGGRLSSAVVVGGKLFVASVDTHAVYALDATTGKKLWSYTSGARVDSSPTVYDGLVLFGSADGYVYCLRASDGELAWRFRAAPIDERLVAFEQLESVWPVHGSVLVQDEVLYFVAGRNMFIDDGIWLYRLEPKTGEILSITQMNDRDPKTGKNFQVNVQELNMPVTSTDILSSDSKRVYMKSLVFDLAGNRQAPGSHSGKAAEQGSVQRGEEAHLFCPTGFLDDAFWHRTYWVYGRSFGGGWGGYWQAGRFAPSGRILTFDDSKVYGYGRKPQYYAWTTPLEHHLWAADKEAPEVSEPAGKNWRLPAFHVKHYWRKEVPLVARAMVLARDILFIAGPPDVVDEEEAARKLGTPEIRAQLAEQDAALAGRKGALLWAVSASDGKRLAEYKLDRPPVFDGLVAARGRLYVSTTDGKVVCFSGR